MQLSRFNLNLFVVFETIYREGSLTRAANILHVTQPTISNSLSQLREAYGDPLFVRSGRGVTPTPMAHRLIPAVRDSLQLMQSSLDKNFRFDVMNSNREFRLSVGDAFAAKLYRLLTPRLVKDAPGVSLVSHQYDRREIIDALASGELDLAIDIPQLSSTTLNHRFLQESDVVCGFREDHPALNHNLTLERLLALDHVTYSSRARGSSRLDLTLGRVGRRIKPKLRVQHFNTALEIVRNSDMVLIASRWLLKEHDLRIRKLPFETQPVETWLYWHRAAEDDPGNRWLRDLIAGVVS